MSRIPNNIHIVYGLAPDFGWTEYDRYDSNLGRTIRRPAADPFNIIRYLTVKSAWDINKPDNIYFYYQHEPYGELWDAVQKYITPVKIEAPTEIFGNPVKHFALKTDIIRLQILLEDGGIYLDSDVLCLKPFTPYLNIEGSKGGCVIGREGMFDDKLTNAVLMAEKDSEFCKRWLAEFTSFDGTWAKHGVMVPYQLSKEYPDLVTVADHKKFTWPLYHTDAMKWLYRGVGWNDSNDIVCDIGGPLHSNETLEESYCIHLWANKHVTNEFVKDFPDNTMNDWMTVDCIRNVDTPFNILAREFIKEL